MIIQVCPFNNENMIARINATENRGIIDKLIIVEANRNFHGNSKKLNYKSSKETENIEYIVFDAKNRFKKNNFFGKLCLLKYRLSFSKYKRSFLCHPTWFNEATQRNYPLEILDIQDEDVYIFSDIDEIVSRNRINDLVNEAKKRGIVTGRLYFTLFYFNLFSKNWGGPEGYSYRLFAMTGKYLKSMKISIDQLRKMGEHGELTDVYCLEGYIGFHHSWLGDEEFIKNKIDAYAHVSEHEEMSSIEYIRDCLKEKKSIFPGHIIELDDSVDLIESVARLRNDESFKSYFL